MISKLYFSVQHDYSDNNILIHFTFNTNTIDNSKYHINPNNTQN